MNEEKLHLRHVMLYEFRKGVTVGTAAKNLRDVYQDHAPAVRTVKKWFAKFRCGDFHLDDQPQPVINDDTVHNLVQNNLRISIVEIAERLNVDRSIAFRHLKKIGYTFKFDVWVPHLLTEENKLQRVSTAIFLRRRLSRDLTFLNRIVTGGEKYIVYNTVQRKRSWKQANEHAEPMARANLFSQVMLSVWWDCRGIIYFELLPGDQTINSDKYCQQLDNLKTAILKKRPNLATPWKGVVFHHDYAKPHIAKQTMQKLKELKWNVILPPPYSPDIAPSDYHLFRSLQDDLSGKTFASLEHLEYYISSFFNAKPETFYNQGIRMLPERWNKIVKNKGDYIND